MPVDTLIWYAPLVCLLAGTVKGGIGIGLPTTIIALLSLVVDPRVAVAMGLAPMILSNLWQTWREGRSLDAVRRFWPLIVTTAIGLTLASQYAADAPAEVILGATGGAVAIFAATSLIGRPPAMPEGWERRAQVAAGVVSGVMGGLTGLWSPPMLMLLLSLRLERSFFISTLGVLLLLGAIPLLAGYIAAGLMTRELMVWSAALTAPVFLGFLIGERIRRKMDAARFQKAFLVFFLLMGLNMVRQAVF